MNLTARVRRSIAALLITVGLVAGTAWAADLSQPITLVATPRLDGSELSQTVLVAAPLQNGMHVGFIVNRPSDLKLAAAFPGHAASRKVVDPLYVGGPLLPDMVYAVVRTPPKDTENLLQLMSGVVLVMDASAIDRIIETTPNDARYFMGLILWQPGELDEEIRAGAWEVNPADAGAVFSDHPEQLWKTLSHGGALVEARSHAGGPSA